MGRDGRWRERGTGLRTAAPAVLVLVAVVAAGCSSSTGGVSSAAVQVSVSRQSSAQLRLPGGVQVDVPAGAVNGSGELSGRASPAPAASPPGLVLAGSAYELSITGTDLTGTVGLAFPTRSTPSPSGAEPIDAAILATWSTTAGWTVVDSRYNANAQRITASSSHLSIWAVFRIDTSALTRWALDALKSRIGLSPSASQPICPGSDQLASIGIAVKASVGDLVLYCDGVSNGQPLVRITNHRNFPIEIDYPSTWSSRPIGAPDAISDASVALVAGAVANTAHPMVAAHILTGGATVEVTAPPGQAGTVLAQPNAGAYIVSAILYGVDTLAMTFDNVPFAPKANPTDTVKAIQAIATTKDCATQIANLVSSSVSNPADVSKEFTAAAKLAFGCLADTWGDAYSLGALTLPLKIISWFADGIKLIITGFQGILESVIYWRGYYIEITHTTPPATTTTSTTTTKPVAAPSATAIAADETYVAQQLGNCTVFAPNCQGNLSAVSTADGAGGFIYAIVADQTTGDQCDRASVWFFHNEQLAPLAANLPPANATGMYSTYGIMFVLGKITSPGPATFAVPLAVTTPDLSFGATGGFGCAIDGNAGTDTYTYRWNGSTIQYVAGLPPQPPAVIGIPGP